MIANCLCVDCQNQWRELHGTRVSEGIGAVRFCPICLSENLHKQYQDECYDKKHGEILKSLVGRKPLLKISATGEMA